MACRARITNGDLFILVKYVARVCALYCKWDEFSYSVSGFRYCVVSMNLCLKARFRL